MFTRLIGKQKIIIRRVFSTETKIKIPNIIVGSMVYGGMVGGLFGTAVGINEGAKPTVWDKKPPKMFDLMGSSMLYGLLGLFTGIPLGIVWPISVPVITIRHFIDK